jgi:hypothetical protein
MRGTHVLCLCDVLAYVCFVYVYIYACMRGAVCEELTPSVLCDVLAYIFVLYTCMCTYMHVCEELNARNSRSLFV